MKIRASLSVNRDTRPQSGLGSEVEVGPQASPRRPAYSARPAGRASRERQRPLTRPAPPPPPRARSFCLRWRKEPAAVTAAVVLSLFPSIHITTFRRAEDIGQWRQSKQVDVKAHIRDSKGTKN